MKRKGTRKYSEDFKEEVKDEIDRFQDRSDNIFEGDDDNTVLKKLVRK